MKNKYLVLIVVSVFVWLNKSQAQTSAEITSEDILQHISYLASDDLEGRFTGTEACSTAAVYLKEHFESYGIKPLFNGSYFQEFPFISGIAAGEMNSLVFITNENENNLDLDENFISAHFSGIVNGQSELVFAGYGISAPKLNYDDYDGLDIKGKVVLVLRYSPEYDNPHSEFDEYSSFRFKATLARDKGAIGIIFVNGHFPKDDDDKLMEMRYDGGSGIKDIGAMQIKRFVADELFKSEGFDLSEIQKNISESKSPSSFQFKNTIVKFSTDVHEVIKNSYNVAGYIEGNDPLLKDQFIVIGAHYDHLGFGENGSLYRGADRQVHNGADDNASGTSGVLELAEKISSVKNTLKHSIIFIAFSGEELGLLGSSYFVNNTPILTEKMAAMVNMDMIGRLNEENQLIVYGTGTSTSWESILNNRNSQDFSLTFNDEGYGPSDHSSFYGKNIPVLFFFTGTHTDYHRPGDDTEKINVTGEQKVISYVYDVVSGIDEMTTKPDYLVVESKEKKNMGGWKVYVGTIPDYASTADGFKLSGVSEGGPAQKAGLLGGDIIISFGSKKITNIYDYVYALQEFVPGDVVEVVVLRDGQQMKFQVELGAK